MEYTSKYSSPLGEILISADDIGITGAWFVGAKYYGAGLGKNCISRETPHILKMKKWLDIYFSGREPDFSPPVHPVGTDFQILIWELLQKIPYGKTVTYGSIAKSAAAALGREKMSAQAVGSAVSRNKISILIPCHRVVGADGSLTGYAAGLDRKIALLNLEKSL